MDWRFWRWLRRSASHAKADSMPASVMSADRRSSRFSFAETCFGVFVVAGVLYEDWDNLPMIIHPNSPQGRMAIGGVIAAFGIVAEVWCSQRSSKAENEVRDWYAKRVAELNLKAEQEKRARVQIEKSIAMRDFTTEQYESFAADLSSFADNLSPRVYLSNAATGGESLLNAALAVDLVAGRPMVLPVIQGMYIVATPDKPSQDLGEAISKALTKCGHRNSWYSTAAYSGADLIQYWPTYIAQAARQSKEAMVVIVVMEQPAYSAAEARST